MLNLQISQLAELETKNLNYFEHLISVLKRSTTAETLSSLHHEITCPRYANSE